MAHTDFSLCFFSCSVQVDHVCRGSSSGCCYLGTHSLSSIQRRFPDSFAESGGVCVHEVLLICSLSITCCTSAHFFFFRQKSETDPTQRQDVYLIARAVLLAVVGVSAIGSAAAFIALHWATPVRAIADPSRW